VTICYHHAVVTMLLLLYLCRFCDDNPGPVFPGSVLLLTVSYKPGYTLDKYWLGNVLRDHWSNEEDVVGPLLSRIGNSFNVIQSANTTETQ